MFCAFHSHVCDIKLTNVSLINKQGDVRNKKKKLNYCNNNKRVNCQLKVLLIVYIHY